MQNLKEIPTEKLREAYLAGDLEKKYADGLIQTGEVNLAEYMYIVYGKEFGRV